MTKPEAENLEDVIWDVMEEMERNGELFPFAEVFGENWVELLFDLDGDVMDFAGDSRAK